jgi:hypothetical protein
LTSTTAWRTGRMMWQVARSRLDVLRLRPVQ